MLATKATCLSCLLNRGHQEYLLGNGDNAVLPRRCSVDVTTVRPVTRPTVSAFDSYVYWFGCDGLRRTRRITRCPCWLTYPASVLIFFPFRFEFRQGSSTPTRRQAYLGCPVTAAVSDMNRDNAPWSAFANFATAKRDIEHSSTARRI